MSEKRKIPKAFLQISYTTVVTKFKCSGLTSTLRRCRRRVFFSLVSSLLLCLRIFNCFFLFQTDLCGIKWRKLVHGESGFTPEPSEDPILSSFSRCLAADILCVWRRVATAAPPSADINGGLFDNIALQTAPVKHPPLSLHAAKELWIFWYGEEPDLSGLVSPELLAGGKYQ